jgi:hypothetical protein
MARRFAGKYSSQPQAPEDPAMREARRPTVLFLLAFLYAIIAFRSPPSTMLLGLLACGLMLLAAWLTREGVRAQLAYEARKIAKRPALPRKIIAAGLMGAALIAGGMMSQAGLLLPISFGMAGAALHLLAFGPDPLADKGMQGIDSFQLERVSRAVSEGEGFLAGMRDAILRAGDTGLEARVDQFATTARGLFRQVENDPADLTGARKFLTVYLMGARDATAKFADAYAATGAPETRADYEALLTDLETSFAERSRALLANDHTDLDVEISVLRERLALEK